MLHEPQTLCPFRSTVAWIALCVVSLFFNACNDTTQDDPRAGSAENPVPRVLLVGLDGVQYEALQEADTPNLDTLRYSRAYTGRDTHTAQKQFTWSGAGWATVLTGTWVDTHGVTGNDDSFRYNTDTVFTHLYAGLQRPFLASFVNWEVIHAQQEGLLEHVDKHEAFPWSLDEEAPSITQVTDAAITAIQTHSPDLTFAMYVNIDEVGHIDGFGPSYQAEIEAVDAEFGRLLHVIDARENEDWLILVTTDHGRRAPEGRNHGELSDDERLIFIGMNHKGNASFQNAFETAHTEEFALAAYPSQTAITPTILRYLDVDILPSYRLGDSPLIGAEGPMRIGFDNEEKTQLTWVSDADTDAVIYKNDTEIGRVPASDGAFEDEDTDVPPDANGHIFYVVEINGSTATLSKNAP